MDLAAERARSARHSIRHQNHQVWATSGRDTQSSWLLQWLACLVEIGEKASIAPDFLFFHCDLESQQHPQIFPSSYSQALLCLRYLAQQLAGLTAEEATSPYAAQHENYPAGGRRSTAFCRASAWHNGITATACAFTAATIRSKRCAFKGS